jgi:hypothetical protein
MTPVFFAALLWSGLFLAAIGCVTEARDKTYSWHTLAPVMVGLALVTWAFTGALF